MTFSAFLYRVLFAVDGAGMVGWVVIVAGSLPAGPADRAPPLLVVVGGAVLNGGAIALGWVLRRKGRPGLACLPLALVSPLAFLGIGILLLVFALLQVPAYTG